MTAPNILIVDDNPNNLRVLEGILQAAGFRVRPALNGETALRAAGIATPDLILLDVRMPGMDGFEVCRRLKESPATRHVPVIFVSALQEVEDKNRAFQAGGVDYIVKPFQGEEVLTRARTHIELAGARRALALANERLEEQVAERTHALADSHARLQTAMRSEHALRELLSLSHHHFADRDYARRAMKSLAANLGWQSPGVVGAILTTDPAADSLRLSVAASFGLDEQQERALAHLAGEGCEAPANGLCIPAVREVLGVDAAQGCQCMPLLSGSQLFGLLVLAGTEAVSVSGHPFCGQVAEILAMGIARRRADERLAWQAYHDELTGLPNRRLLEEELLREMRAAQGRGECCGILLLDLDHFKLLNDALGHGTGDLFLKEVAGRIEATVRASDHLFRWGGDEFIVLMANLGRYEEEAAAHARALAGKITESLEIPLQAGGQDVHLNASMGIALYPSDGSSVEELLRHVDLAMHKAKNAGRNATHFFRPEMQGEAERRLRIEKEMRQALREERFLLHFQPQVDGEGRLFGAESLVRWQHPERGLVFPGEFIAIAEESGLIHPLSDWVLEAACRQLREWAPGLVRFLAVNVSARQFHQSDFVDRVRRIIDATGAPPDALELEVTESLLLADVDGAVSKMDALRAIGIRFSVDDFGTGYSSLAYLKRLPVDQLKIDRSFVHGVHTDSRNASIVRTIISLARNLGLKTIAEGVEEEGEALFLREAGCDHYQGYLFGKPLPVEAFEGRFRSTAGELPGTRAVS